jgi:hypothetical protein
MIERLTKRYCIKFIYIIIDISFIFLSIWLAAYLRKGTLPFPITVENLFLNDIKPLRQMFFKSI